MLAMRNPDPPFLDSVERRRPGTSLRAYVTRTLPHSSTIVVANRAPHEPRPDGGFTRGAGGVITALLSLAEVTAGEWVAGHPSGTITPPQYNYWTDDNLQLTSGSTGNCSVAISDAGAGSGACPNRPMRVGYRDSVEPGENPPDQRPRPGRLRNRRTGTNGTRSTTGTR